MRKSLSPSPCSTPLCLYDDSLGLWISVKSVQQLSAAFLGYWVLHKVPGPAPERLEYENLKERLDSGNVNRKLWWEEVLDCCV